MYSKCLSRTFARKFLTQSRCTRSGTSEVSVSRQQARDGARAMGVAVSNAIKWTPRMEKHATQALAGIAAQRRKEKRRDRADMKKEGPSHRPDAFVISGDPLKPALLARPALPSQRS